MQRTPPPKATPSHRTQAQTHASVLTPQTNPRTITSVSANANANPYNSAIPSNELPPPQPLPFASPSLQPQAAKVISLERHIQELVYQNTETERARSKAQERLDQISAELKAARENQLFTKEQWKVERTEWREGCNALQTVHNVSHLRTSLMLDSERLAKFRLSKQLRLQKVNVLIRDQNLQLFKGKERELEWRIESLEYQIASEQAEAQDRFDLLEAEKKDVIEELEGHLDESLDSLDKLKEEQANFQKLTKAIQLQLDDLKTRHATLNKEHNAQTLHVDTVAAELDASKAKLRETESDLRSKQAEIKKLRKSEERDEEVIKEKMELEMRVIQLEKELDELDVARNDVEARLKKEKVRASALDKEVKEVKDSFAAAQRDIKSTGKEWKDVKSQLSQAQKEIAKLKSELEIVRKEALAAAVKKLTPPLAPKWKKKAPPAPATTDEDEMHFKDQLQDEEFSPPPLPQIANKKKSSAPVRRRLSPSSAPSRPPSPGSKPRAMTKPSTSHLRPQRAEIEDEDEEDFTEAMKKAPTSKPKAPVAEKNQKHAEVSDGDEEEEEDFTKAMKKASSGGAAKQPAAQTRPSASRSPEAPAAKIKPKATTTAKKRAREASEEAEEQQPKAQAKPKTKSRQKLSVNQQPTNQHLAVPDDQDDGEKPDKPTARAKGKQKAASEQPTVRPPPTKKPVSTTGGTRPRKAVVEAEDDQDSGEATGPSTPKKKKRKIGAVLGAGGKKLLGGGGGWNWDGGRGDGDDDVFAIPLGLSPVKKSGGGGGGIKRAVSASIPSRSLFSNKAPKGHF
ncbi:hypothetical protein FRB97_004756 [Tulasnella sp. 331]|nr:hypothetical protein FRB97_004756 [Tulasnella sp. 331]KAG8889401.1 hypothetical protein FRB98_004494 [Tulasnella sp. 332]